MCEVNNISDSKYDVPGKMYNCVLIESYCERLNYFWGKCLVIWIKWYKCSFHVKQGCRLCGAKIILITPHKKLSKTSMGLQKKHLNHNHDFHLRSIFMNGIPHYPQQKRRATKHHV